MSLDVKHSAATPTAAGSGSNNNGGASSSSSSATAGAGAAPVKDAASVNEQLNREVAEFFTLHRACFLGATKTIETLLDEGANPDSFEAVSGMSCLMLASSGGHLKAAAAIIQRKRANVNLQATHTGGLTALHYAAMNDHLDVVKLLLSSGANPNIEDDAGNTAVNACARNGHVQCLEALSEKSANLDHANKKLSTPLLGAALNGRTAVLDFLLRQPSNAINLNATDARGNSALHIASKLGYTRVVEQLLRSGARTDIVNLDGDKPDHCALNDATAKLFKSQSAAASQLPAAAAVATAAKSSNASSASGDALAKAPFP